MKRESLFDVVIDGKYVHTGKYKGCEWSSLSATSLKEIIAEYHPESIMYQQAVKQIKKRDIPTTKPMDISIHAINRMSSRFLDEYISNRKELPNGEQEGIYNYTLRSAWNAIESGEVVQDDNHNNSIAILWENKKFCFVRLKDGTPRLVTITPNE